MSRGQIIFSYRRMQADLREMHKNIEIESKRLAREREKENKYHTCMSTPKSTLIRIRNKAKNK